MLQNSPIGNFNGSEGIVLQDLFAKLNQLSVEDAAEQPRVSPMCHLKTRIAIFSNIRLP